MADQIYINEDGSIRQLDLVPAPEFAQRIEALEKQNAAQDEAISAAQSSADEKVSAVEELLRDLVEEEKAALQGQIQNAVPVGTVMPFAANTTPEGYLLCNGAAVSRTTYAKLYEAIGTTYGTGNGSTTFNLPNLTDKFIQGSGTAGTVKGAGLPNISWTIHGVITTGATYSGAADGTNTYLNKIDVGSGYGDHISTFYGSAASSNDIYGSSSTVQPPALTMRYYIKY